MRANSGASSSVAMRHLSMRMRPALAWSLITALPYGEAHGGIVPSRRGKFKQSDSDGVSTMLRELNQRRAGGLSSK